MKAGFLRCHIDLFLFKDIIFRSRLYGDMYLVALLAFLEKEVFTYVSQSRDC